MFVVKRKLGQELLINNDIRIVFIRDSPKWIRIGIESKNPLSVFRAELLKSDEDEIDDNKGEGE